MAITRLNNNSLTSITALPTAITTGKILQVQSTLLQTHFTVSVTASTNTEITNLNVNITPSSSSSKILLFGRLFCEASTTDV